MGFFWKVEINGYKVLNIHLKLFIAYDLQHVHFTIYFTIFPYIGREKIHTIVTGSMAVRGYEMLTIDFYNFRFGTSTLYIEGEGTINVTDTSQLGQPMEKSTML